MADQKSRGGQKEVTGQATEKEEHRTAHQDGDQAPRRTHHMKEDAARGQQGDNGGYNEQPARPQSGD